MKYQILEFYKSRLTAKVITYSFFYVKGVFFFSLLKWVFFYEIMTEMKKLQIYA